MAIDMDMEEIKKKARQFNEFQRKCNEIRRREEEDILVSVDGIEVSNVYDVFGYVDKNNNIFYILEFVTKNGGYYHWYNVADSRLVFKRKGE